MKRKKLGARPARAYATEGTIWHSGRRYVLPEVAATRLGVGRIHVYRLIRKGYLDAEKIDRRGRSLLVIPASAVERRRRAVATWRSMLTTNGLGATDAGRFAPRGSER